MLLRILNRMSLIGAVVTNLCFGQSQASATTMDFQLMTWGSSGATAQLPTAAGRKPSGSAPTAGDWLVFTGDDEQLPTTYNPQGALSHNLVDLTGAGGAAYNSAPSLTGSLSLQLNASAAGNYDVAVTSLAYSGQATPVLYMNQFLVAPGSPATQNPAMNVNGSGNAGVWHATAASNYAIQYSLDYYLATNADGDPTATDIDATFDDKTQSGYLVPVSAITPAGLSALSLDDPAGFFSGDFDQYLLSEIAPRLPSDATYLLVTQMAKVHPNYVEPGLPITTASFIGNTTIAYTTAIVPEPASVMLLAVAGFAFRRRFRGHRVA